MLSTLRVFNFSPHLLFFTFACDTHLTHPASFPATHSRRDGGPCFQEAVVVGRRDRSGEGDEALGTAAAAAAAAGDDAPSASVLLSENPSEALAKRTSPMLRERHLLLKADKVKGPSMLRALCFPFSCCALVALVPLGVSLQINGRCVALETFGTFSRTQT